MNKNLNEIFNKINKKAKLSIAGGFTSFLVLAFVILALVNSSNVYSVSIDGKDLGYVDSQNKVQEIISAETEKIKKEFTYEEITFDDTRFSLLKTNLKKDEVKLLSNEEIVLLFSDRKLYSKDAWVIKVEGKSIVSAASQEDANAIIDGVKSSFKADKSELVSSSFKEKVEIANELTPVDQIMKIDEAEQYILTGTTEAKTYTVKSGDTMWGIANSLKMSPYELQEANPGFSPDKLKIGQSLNMFIKKPFVNVTTVEKIAEKKDIPYKTIYESTNALYKGEVKVKTAGVNGQESLVSEITKENGVWVATKVISTDRISEPKTAIALKGTKSLSTFVGSGYLASPLSGAISSAFGSRGSGRHTGIDIPAPKGTAIRAADDGVVSVASNGSGTYGKLIKINHGKGVETLYGHCNEILVKVGQKVSKGDVIATVGITGRATGYHLHFELRMNGIQVNPARYI